MNFKIRQEVHGSNLFGTNSGQKYRPPTQNQDIMKSIAIEGKSSES